eukprot:1004565-Prorocentrum_lima.AAC.1
MPQGSGQLCISPNRAALIRQDRFGGEPDSRRLANIAWTSGSPTSHGHRYDQRRMDMEFTSRAWP